MSEPTLAEQAINDEIQAHHKLVEVPTALRVDVANPSWWGWLIDEIGDGFDSLSRSPEGWYAVAYTHTESGKIRWIKAGDTIGEALGTAMLYVWSQDDA